MNKLFSKVSTFDIAIALAIAIFFAADRILKIWALNSLMMSPVRLIGNLLSFDFTANHYIAFSLPLSGPLLNAAILGILVLLTIIIIFLALSAQPRRFEISFLACILLGAISNFFDRISYGYVIDYLDLQYFTVFNLADIMISGGALALIIKFVRNK
ncbi:MAG: signal peptidase II [Patescibacteria group bacterium]